MLLSAQCSLLLAAGGSPKHQYGLDGRHSMILQLPCTILQAGRTDSPIIHEKGNSRAEYKVLIML